MGAKFEFNEKWLREMKKPVKVPTGLTKEQQVKAVIDEKKRRGLLK